MTGAGPSRLPAWADYGLIPLLNLTLAFLVAGVVVVILGESPLEALRLMLQGAFGYEEGVGYTLFYATNFVFTGLAVAVAFHAGLFNIGGEGQAMLGGIGLTLVALQLGWLPWPVLLPAAMLAAGLFGALWAAIPGWLQAYRGSHVVITTIMFNFIASALLTYLLVNVLIKPGQSSPETRVFDEAGWLPQMHVVLGWLGVDFGQSPFNLASLVALGLCFAAWVFIWKTRMGYELRVVGRNERAAVYGGVSPKRYVVLAMVLSGAVAGCMALNEILGSQHRLTLGFTGGYGFVGIAVALMGRNHPLGIVLAAILFGALYQGGSDLAFDMPAITRDMVVVIQGLVILFCGALEHMLRPYVAVLFARRPVEVPA